MPPDESSLFTDSLEFLSLVAQLRSVAPQYRSLALFASDHWTDAQFFERLQRAPDVPAEPMPATAPNLKLVQ